MLTPDQFRCLALAMDGAIESAHMGHPDFRANGRIFATLHPANESRMIKLTPEQQQELLQEGPGAFVPASGAWGTPGMHDREVDGCGRGHPRSGHHACMAEH